MLQCVKRFFRRTQKGDKGKVNALILSEDGLNLENLAPEEKIRRVSKYLDSPHENYLHIRGEHVSNVYVITLSSS
jgi:hypothetical protein